MVFLMVGNTEGSVTVKPIKIVTELVDCSKKRPIQEICPRLPAGCDVQKKMIGAGNWKKIEPLVTYTNTILCHHPTRGTYRSLEGLIGPRSNQLTPINSDEEDLCVVIVGGVLMATATISRSVSNVVYVATICSARNSGAGSYILDHIRQNVTKEGETVRLCPLQNEALFDFYKKKGFKKKPLGFMNGKKPNGRETSKKKDLAISPQSMCRCIGSIRCSTVCPEVP